MHGRWVENDSPYMSRKIGNFVNGAKGGRWLSGQSLIKLAQSEMGLAAEDERIEELLASMQAHVAARGFPEDWSKIEVPRLLHGWVCCYASVDLGQLLVLWVDLLLWMRQLGVLPESKVELYLADTRSWLADQRSLVKVYDRLWCVLGKVEGRFGAS